MAADPLGFLADWHRRLGPVFRVRAGHLKLVVLAGEEANGFVDGEGADLFSSRETWAPTLAEFGALNNFVGLDGEPHRLLRKLFAGQFSKRAAEARLDLLIDLTIRAFSERPRGGEIPFVAFGQALASRQVGSLLVGRVPSQAEHHATLRYTNAVVVNLSLRRLPRWTLHLRGPRFWHRYRPPRNEYRRPNVFAPYGRGPHFCLGAGLAGVQMAGTLATILHHCDLELAEPSRAFGHVLRPSLSLGPKFRIRFRGWRCPVAIG